jgi:uncharacterized protein (TIGR04255 family)
VFSAHGGNELRAERDALFVAFTSAVEAAAAGPVSAFIDYAMSFPAVTLFKRCSRNSDGRTMPLDLTELNREVLPHAPLASVICQVRYEATPRASEAITARAFFDQLSGGERFQRLDQIIEATVNVAVAGGGPPSLAQQASSSGWRLTSADGSRIISLMPSHVSLEVTSYDGWENDFAPLLSEVLAAVAELVAPVFEQRLGLRYINQIVEPDVTDGPSWRTLIDESFLGLANHDEVGPTVAFLRQQGTLELDDDGSTCIVNCGYAPDPDREGSLTFLLDFDISREGMRPFDAAEVCTVADRFNEYALRLFQLATTDALRATFA